MTDGYPVCHDCGNVDMTRVLYVPDFYSNGTSRFIYKQIVIYKRRNYFESVLKFTTCKEIMTSKRINIIAKELKKSKIKDINEIKKWMKLKKYNKQVKFIYSIYFLAYGVKLLDISYSQYDQVIRCFNDIDLIYKNKIGKRNQLNYNYIIYKIFDKLNIETKHVLLPKTFDKLELQFDKLYT